MKNEEMKNEEMKNGKRYKNINNVRVMRVIMW